jgi:hypothetical protein
MPAARWANNGGALFALLVLLGILAWAIRGYFYAEAPVRLAFPLQGGWYSEDRSYRTRPAPRSSDRLWAQNLQW